MSEKNYEQYKRIFRFFEAIFTLAAMTGVFSYAWYMYINPLSEKPFTGKGNLFEIAVYLVVTLILLRIYGGLEVGFYTPLNVILSQVLAMFCTNFLMLIEMILRTGSLYMIGKIMLASACVFAVQILASVVLVLIFDKIYTGMFPAWDMLVIYENDSVRMFLDKVNTRKDKYVVSETIHISKGFEKIKESIAEHGSVIIYDIESNLRNDILKYCYGQGIRVYQTPKISDILIRSAREHHMFDTPLLTSNNIGLTFEQKFIKRFFDIVISLLMIVLTSPIMLITALCIKIEDGGPVMFRQKRVTLGNTEFMILKFRSMIVDAEKDGAPRPAVDNDDRITHVGHFIRKTRIDELPQLFNVLGGKMSIVGPRPERVEHVEKYTQQIPEFEFRTRVKGGLTGYAQVYGKYNTSAYDKLKLDLMYIENYSLALDFRILVMTVKVLFMKSSTEGFNKNNSGSDSDNTANTVNENDIKENEK